MVMSAHARAALRLFKKHIARLITIVAIVVVSVGFMAGVGEVESKIKIAIDNHYQDYNLSDIYIKSKNAYGFSADELNSITEKFGADNVEKSFCYEIEENGEILRVYSLDLENKTVNKLDLLDGKLPTESNEILAERATKDFKEYAIGEKVTLQGQEYTVCGIVFNPLMIIKTNEPSFAFDGESLNGVFYLHSPTPFLVNDVHATLNDRDLFAAYSDGYEQEIDKFKADLEETLGAENVSVLSLYENAGLYSLVSYGEKVGLIGVVFVVFFLLVTLLIVYSTMSRLFDEERSQIACQKTLGYGDLTIVGKYVLFVLIATAIGGLLAFPVGLGLTNIVYFAFGIQYEMPPFPFTPDFYYYFLTFAIILISTTALTLVNSLKIVKNKPVTLLAHKAPKEGKKVLLEKIPPIWNRLSFKYKSTLRNVFLFKSRFFMTVLSVIGSTVLIFAGMGLMDCAVKVDGAESLVTISIALIAFSAALCALVVYNLTNINVSERNREIATLMVLGYHDQEVTGYIFREVYIMSFIGAILGIPLGLLFVGFVFDLVKFGAIADINWWTYVLTPIVTMVFAFLSTKLLRKKIISTDMNASLKTLE